MKLLSLVGVLLLGASLSEACSCPGCSKIYLWGNKSKFVVGKQCPDGQLAAVESMYGKTDHTKFDFTVRAASGRQLAHHRKKKCVNQVDLLVSDDAGVSIETMCRTCFAPGCNCQVKHAFNFACVDAETGAVISRGDDHVSYSVEDTVRAD
ncbi:MAG: hypothetical protein MHM6MM_002339 [Cercozoa sp. M6MM]